MSKNKLLDALDNIDNRRKVNKVENPDKVDNVEKQDSVDHALEVDNSDKNLLIKEMEKNLQPGQRIRRRGSRHGDPVVVEKIVAEIEVGLLKRFRLYAAFRSKTEVDALEELFDKVLPPLPDVQIHDVLKE